MEPNPQAFIRVPVTAIVGIAGYLRSIGMETEANHVLDFGGDYTDPARNLRRQEWVERARDQVAKDGEVEVDNDATISRSEDNGEYVLAWVWVDGPEEASGD
jgi:hypothetical protein